MILQNSIMELHYGIASWKYDMELRCGLRLHNHVTESYYEPMLQNYITELHYAIIWWKYTADAVTQGHAYKDKAPSDAMRIRTRTEGPLMAARAGGRGAEQLHAGNVKDRKGWCRAPHTTTAEPAFERLGQGQKHPFKRVARRDPGDLLTAWSRGKFQKIQQCQGGCKR